MDKILDWAVNQGFSFFVAVWLLIRFERVITDHTATIRELISAIEMWRQDER